MHVLILFLSLCKLASSDYTYLGCFSNADGRPSGSAPVQNSVDSCGLLRTGQAFIALEYGGQCWDNWGNRHTDDTLHQKLPDSDCEGPGEGPGFDSTGKRMGGPNAVAVYSNGGNTGGSSTDGNSGSGTSGGGTSTSDSSGGDSSTGGSTGSDGCLPPSTSTHDAGYEDEYRGWYDVQGCGKCNDYCRWVGSAGSGGDPALLVRKGGSVWSCRKAGTNDASSFSFDNVNNELIPRYGDDVEWNNHLKCTSKGVSSCKSATSSPVSRPNGGLLRTPKTYPSIVEFPTQRGGFNENDEEFYLGAFDALIQDSYSELTTAPPSLLAACADKPRLTNPETVPEVIVIADNTDDTDNFIISAASLSSQCGESSICIVPENIKLIMNGNINVAALVLRGSTLLWDSTTQTTNEQYLCAGYVVVEGNKGTFHLHLNNQLGRNKRAWIYIKDNDASHPYLRTRAFGAYGGGGTTPTIDIAGRPLKRTWSLLAETLSPWDESLRTMHDPYLMGWRVGDRIQVAPTDGGSQGEAQTFVITSLGAFNRIHLNTWAWATFQSETQVTENVDENAPKLASLRSAEVINLSRNIIVTGDDFRNIDCDPTLSIHFRREISDKGCWCRTGVRSKCTMGLHTIQMYGGVTKWKHVRVEKCGQRGILGKYCLHPHLVGDCPDCVFDGNAIEYGHQRAINIHGTHRMLVSNNVMTDVRGAAIYIEDGNEMWNDLFYNVAICPWKLGDKYKRGW